MSYELALETLRAKVGTEVHVSPWVEVTQERVARFADATGDHQWIHVDTGRAARESPYGGTIAHGYLTLSLYPSLRGLVEEGEPPFPGVRNVINYGINKLRFPSPVPVGSRLRLRTTLLGVEEIPGGLQITEASTFEVEGATKPACAAELIMRLYFAES
jgi:acyl dehydratase